SQFQEVRELAPQLSRGGHSRWPRAPPRQLAAGGCFLDGRLCCRPIPRGEGAIDGHQSPGRGTNFRASLRPSGPRASVKPISFLQERPEKVYLRPTTVPTNREKKVFGCVLVRCSDRDQSWWATDTFFLETDELSLLLRG
ncbi:unnamed protein product, partial [Scytosiphon promiscuus]